MVKTNGWPQASDLQSLAENYVLQQKNSRGFNEDSARSGVDK